MLDLRWPGHGPSFNRWNQDAAAFAALLQAHPGFWCYDFPLKYLNLRIDTRDGGFILYGRDGQKIAPDRVLCAIAKWRGWREPADAARSASPPSSERARSRDDQNQAPDAALQGDERGEG